MQPFNSTVELRNFARANNTPFTALVYIGLDLIFVEVTETKNILSGECWFSITDVTENRLSALAIGHRGI